MTKRNSNPAGRDPKNKPKTKKRKVELVFDPNKRKEFLTGFSKRKEERKTKARIYIENQLKVEKKKIRSEAKSSVDKLYRTFKPIPDLKDILQEEEQKEEYETENVTVKIVELSTKDIAKKNNWIGDNKPVVDQEDSSDEESENGANTIPGMDLNEKKATSKKDKEKQKENDDSQKSNVVKSFENLKSKKDINKVMKKETLKTIQNSKAFKMKDRLQRTKNIKLARREKNIKKKTQKNRPLNRASNKKTKKGKKR